MQGVDFRVPLKVGIEVNNLHNESTVWTNNTIAGKVVQKVGQIYCFSSAIFYF